MLVLGMQVKFKVLMVPMVPMAPMLVLPGVPVTVPTLLLGMIGELMKSPMLPLLPPMRGESTYSRTTEWVITSHQLRGIGAGQRQMKVTREAQEQI